MLLLSRPVSLANVLARIRRLQDDFRYDESTQDSFNREIQLVTMWEKKTLFKDVVLSFFFLVIRSKVNSIIITILQKCFVVFHLAIRKL